MPSPHSPHMVALKLSCPLKGPSFPYITMGTREKGESVAGNGTLLMLFGLAMLAKSRVVFPMFGLLDTLISKVLQYICKQVVNILKITRLLVTRSDTNTFVSHPTDSLFHACAPRLHQIQISSCLFLTH